jgi:hypothetical protein
MPVTFSLEYRQEHRGSWTVPSSGIRRRVVRWVSTDVSEEHIASIFRVEEISSAKTSKQARGKQKEKPQILRRGSWLLKRSWGHLECDEYVVPSQFLRQINYKQNPQCCQHGYFSNDLDQFCSLMWLQNRGLLSMQLKMTAWLRIQLFIPGKYQAMRTPGGVHA